MCNLTPTQPSLKGLQGFLFLLASARVRLGISKGWGLGVLALGNNL